MPYPGDLAQCVACDVQIRWWENLHSGGWKAVQRQDSPPGECPQTERRGGRHDGHTPRPLDQTHHEKATTG